MAQQFRSTEVVVPAGTAKADPLIADIGFPDFVVDSISVQVPPGPLGNVGFQIASSGVQVIPWNAGEWIVTDHEVLSFPVDDFPTTGDFQLVAYNTGVYDHSLWVRFALDTIVQAAPAAPPVVNMAAISSPPPQTDDQTADAQAALDALLAQSTDLAS